MQPSAPALLPWQELILGGQKSGKTRRAEQAARTWLDGAPGREAVYLATGQAWDAEMRQRIQRHQDDRAARVPGMRTQEAPRALAQALQACSQPQTLVVVDCLTLWLTHWMMPMEGVDLGLIRLQPRTGARSVLCFWKCWRPAPARWWWWATKLAWG